jgi:putative ABC transport system substrate-binding protein
VIISAFRQEFQKLGWAEGQTLRIDVRFAAADPNRMRGYAAELVGLAPDVMLSNTPAATADAPRRL